MDNMLELHNKTPVWNEGKSNQFSHVSCIQLNIFKVVKKNFGKRLLPLNISALKYD